MNKKKGQKSETKLRMLLIQENVPKYVSRRMRHFTSASQSHASHFSVRIHVQKVTIFNDYDTVAATPRSNEMQKKILHIV